MDRQDINNTGRACAPRT